MISKVDLKFYLDMDNVLVYFSDKDNEEYQLSRVLEKEFYLRLRPNKGAYRLIKLFDRIGIEYNILSGLVKDSITCESEKREWCRRVLGVREDKLRFLPMDERKADAVANLWKGAVLVDDYKRYLKEWDEEGGTSIQCGRSSNSGFCYIAEIWRLAEWVKDNVEDLTDKDKLLITIFLDSLESEVTESDKLSENIEMYCVASNGNRMCKFSSVSLMDSWADLTERDMWQVYINGSEFGSYSEGGFAYDVVDQIINAVESGCRVFRLPKDR